MILYSQFQSRFIIRGALVCKIAIFGGVGIAGANNVPLTLTAEATTFDVSVPMSLPISVSNAGVVSTATNVKLVNNSPLGNVVVSDVTVTVTARSGWSLENFGANFKGKRVNAKEVSFMLNNSCADKINDKFDIGVGNWGQ